MNDPILKSFLEAQLEAGQQMAAASDLLELMPLGPFPPQQYMVELSCTGLIREAGVVKECNRFLVGIQFGRDHLRRVDGRSLVTILAPNSVFAPNVLGPAICVGYMPPAVGIVDLTFQVAEILSYKKFTLLEWDALNPEACRWARANIDRFPIDPRPLLRPTRTPRHSCDTPGR